MYPTALRKLASGLTEPFFTSLGRSWWLEEVSGDWEIMTTLSIFLPEGLKGGQENSQLVSFTFSSRKVME